MEGVIGSSLLFIVAIVPFLEEILKLAIARLLRGGVLQIPSCFFFFVAESLAKIPEVFSHCAQAGVSDLSAVLGTASVVIGSSIFHLYTSILYSLSWRVLYALLVGFAIHAVLNLIAVSLPPLSFGAYVTVPWILSSISGLLVWAYYAAERRLAR